MCGNATCSERVDQLFFLNVRLQKTDGDDRVLVVLMDQTFNDQWCTEVGGEVYVSVSRHHQSHVVDLSPPHPSIISDMNLTTNLSSTGNHIIG